MRGSVSALDFVTLVLPAFLSIDSEPGYRGERELEGQAACPQAARSVSAQLHARP